MRRKQSALLPNAAEYDDDDDDDRSTPTRIKLRRSPPNSGGIGIMVRSRYEIDHGSSDWIATNSSSNDNEDNNDNDNNDNDNNDDDGNPSSPIPPPSTSPQHSPTAAGLHHRRKQHFVDATTTTTTTNNAGASSSFPTQQQQHHYLTLPVAATAAIAAAHDARHSLVHPASGYAAKQRKGSYGYTGHGNTTATIGGGGASSLSSLSSSRGNKAVIWKKALQCLFLVLSVGYFAFLYLAQSRYYWKDPDNHHGDRHYKPPGNAIRDGPRRRSKAGKNRAPQLPIDGFGATKNDDDDDGSSAKRNHYPSARHGNENEDSKQNPLANSLVGNRNYAFRSVGNQQQRLERYEEPSAPAFQRASEWSKDPLRKAKKARAERTKHRRQRSTPPAKQPSALPLWYELDYSSATTLSSLHRRWAEDDDDDNAEVPTDASSSTHPLCGAHANEASKHRPANYLPPFPSDRPIHRRQQQRQPPPSQPLGPQSRVLISGILSPLGLHLAIALRRRCNVTSFMGLDSQMPNDPLARLEQQERLAALMQELEGAKQLQVPFLGLEIRGDRKGARRRREEGRREERLRSVFAASMGGVGAAGEDGYARPYERYGIPLSPGTGADGSGSLDVLLDYRPTHIVHLAGTQSDALLNSNYRHRGARPNDGPRSPSFQRGGNGPAFQNKQEEEEDILKETISSRPHLYDLRMGETGMEQLLSGVVAQSMLPPRYGREDGKGEPRRPSAEDLPPAELAKMKRPHIVYASSYDALQFRDAAHRLNRDDNASVSTKKHKHEENDEEVLGSASKARKPPSRGLHGVSRLVDELLSASYHALHGISSIGLRFDAIYGPRSFGVPSMSVPLFHADRIKKRRGVSPDVDLSEAAVRSLYRGWVDGIKKAREGTEEGKENEEGEREDTRRLGELSLIEEAGWMHLAHDRRDFVFVEDAVGAIIAAMQYRAVDNSPTSFNIGSGEMSPLSSLSDEIQELVNMAANENNIGNDETFRKEFQRSSSKHVIDVERSSAARAASLSSNDYLRWEAKTSLKDGAAKLLAWHLDRALPFFPPASATDNEVSYSWSHPLDTTDDELPFSVPLDGEGLLSRRGIESCSNHHDDPTCLREAHTKLPCASECSTQSCAPSVYDSIIPVTHTATEDCDVVLYTMLLGYDVEELLLETEYSDGEEQEEWMETTVCTIAFVPAESTLVKGVIDQVSDHSLNDRGVTIDEYQDHDAKVKKLNGYLAHHGWILIFVPGASQPISAEDMFLPKLSPGRLFHSTVRKAMFVDESFSHTPLPEDAQFLASETSRGVLKQRTVVGPDAKGKKTKYKLPEEPQRRAIIVVSPMRHVPEVEGHKVPLKEVTILMMKELGLDFTEGEDGEEKETNEIRTQREYYERSRSLINSFDLRSLNSVSRHRLEIKDFIRSRWIVHHLKLEEGHQLRCEWYREHIKWSTHLDQSSFAYVMAKRDLVRKISTREPLVTEAERAKVTILQQIIKIKSDAHEWHPIFSSSEGAEYALHHSQMALEEIPVNLQDLPDNEVNENVRPDLAFSDVGSTYYVRIMSDERMLESRKKWMKARNNHRKNVAKIRARAEENDE